MAMAVAKKTAGACTERACDHIAAETAASTGLPEVPAIDVFVTGVKFDQSKAQVCDRTDEMPAEGVEAEGVWAKVVKYAIP